MSDAQHRKYHAGKYPDFTPSEEENKRMEEQQRLLDKSFGGLGPDNAKKLRSKTAEEIEKQLGE